MNPTRFASLLVAASVLALCSGSGTVASTNGPSACPRRVLDRAYLARVEQALRASEDAWGNELLRSPDGPTYAGARRYLTPLTLARAAKGTGLTRSGFHYVAFSGQVGAGGAGTMALHVADGSQLVAQRSSGRSLTVAVGRSGDERFGSCGSRLDTPHLAEGYLPVLQTGYVDADGARYRQESFATRLGRAGTLVSFARLSVDTRGSGPARLRFTSSEDGIRREGASLKRRDGSTALAFAPGGAVEGSAVVYAVPAERTRTVYVAWPIAAGRTIAVQPGESEYTSARSQLIRYWKERLAEGPSIRVPEAPVMNAARALLIQNLALTWRYSVGNQYQQFSYPEGVDAAQAMSAQGFPRIARAILLKSFETPLTRYPNWKMAQKLVGSALFYRLFRDRAFVERATPHLRRYVADLGRQIRSSPTGMLRRERFSSDIADPVYGLHTHATAWQGLRSMALVWNETGHGSLAAEARRLAARLETGLRRAIARSERRLPDGSLFIPARLLDPEQPYQHVTDSRSGSYWNLVAPYAFASGFFAPNGGDSDRIIRYLLRHGSRLLGLVRAGVFSLYGLDASYPTSGVNPVYGLNVARFLADNHRSDQLVLSLYGQLAVAMAPGTFVAGEGVSIAPLGRASDRSTYLPPNGASNASFLETLRLALVHETRGPDLEPRGLELAFATPRAWLAPGKRVAVGGLPTTFGPVSYSIRSHGDRLDVTVVLPARSKPAVVALRLRMPDGRRMVGVMLNDRPYTRFDARRELVDLSDQAGRVELVVRTRR